MPGMSCSLFGKAAAGLSPALICRRCVWDVSCWHQRSPHAALRHRKGPVGLQSHHILAFASVGLKLVNDAKTAAAAVLSLALPGPAALTIIATAVSILLSLKFYRENR